MQQPTPAVPRRTGLTVVLVAAVLAYTVLHLLLVAGVVVIPPAPPRDGVNLQAESDGVGPTDATSRPPQRTKLFGIGLSRTGTTSLTMALHELGYEVHHFCAQLATLPTDVPTHSIVGLLTEAAGGRPDSAVIPAAARTRLNPYWADVFDAHTDFAPALVWTELARHYPTAQFVLTVRNPDAWADGMLRFTGKHAYLMPDGAFTAMYGPWRTLDHDGWKAAYLRHFDAVKLFFEQEAAERPDIVGAAVPAANAEALDRVPGAVRVGRLLVLDVTGGADGGSQAWRHLVAFTGAAADLGVGGDGAGSTATPRAAFPRKDVFDLHFRDQAWWQVRRLGDWAVAKPIAGAAVFWVGAACLRLLWTRAPVFHACLVCDCCRRHSAHRTMKTA